MKPLPILILLTGCFGCSGQPSKPIFHVRVVPYYCWGSGQNYCIEATNDNWANKIRIMECFDLTDLGDNGETDICHQERLFNERQDAIDVARTIKTWDRVLAINAAAEKEKDRLIAFYRRHPGNIPPKAVKQNCCKNDPIQVH